MSLASITGGKISSVEQEVTSEPHDPETGIMQTAVFVDDGLVVFPPIVPDFVGLPEFVNVNVPLLFVI